MKIGIVATRLAGVDGVTFETAKWEAVLDGMGHELRLCAGEVDALRYQARLVPPMHFSYPPAARVTAAAFDAGSDPDAVRAEIDRLADLLLPVLLDWANLHDARCPGRRERVGHPDAPAARRCAAPPRGGAAGCRPSAITTTTGGSASGSPRCVVPEVLEEAFPPDLPWVKHVSINSLAARALRDHRGLTLDGGPERVRLQLAAPAALAGRSVASCGASSG